MYNYEINTSSYSLPPIHQDMLLNYFLLFRKFTKKERLITETFLNFREKELKAEWFTTFQNMFSLEYLISTRRKKTMVRTWSVGTEVLWRCDMRILKCREAAEPCRQAETGFVSTAGSN